MPVLARVSRIAAELSAAPIVFRSLLSPATGRDHGVGLAQKLLLLVRMVRNVRRIPALSHVYEHVAIATALLRIPPETEGCVVECGTYAGASTANLSLVCSLVGRELEVFDSFEGLPAPDARDADVELIDGSRGHYNAGAFSASLETVQANVTRWGEPAVCHYHPGFFADTLPGFRTPVALAFIDVDLRASAEDCLRHLWPLLSPGGRLYTHEAQELQIARLFFDDHWWNDALGHGAPGLAGAGSGLGLIPVADGYASELGYTTK